jgi:acetolactate synthase-1/2/3 large subunit
VSRDHDAEQTAAYQKRSQPTVRQPIHPLRLAHEINEFLTEDSIYMGDAGDIVTFSGCVVQPKSPGHWTDPGPLGTLGEGSRSHSPRSSRDPTRKSWHFQ